MNKIGARSFHSFEAVGNLNSSASDLEGKKKTMKTAENRTLEMMQMMPLISIYFFKWFNRSWLICISRNFVRILKFAILLVDREGKEVG